LVGLLALGFAFSPSCQRVETFAGGAVPGATDPGTRTFDAGVAVVDAGTNGGPLPRADAVVVERPGVIAGQIVAQTGEVEGALVTLAGSGVWPARVVQAGADGGFRFDDVPTGIYGVSAQRGSRVAEPREGIWLDSGGRVFLALRLDEGATLSGRVVSAVGGEAIAGAELRISADSLALAPRTTRSDAAGRFRFEGLLPRSQSLSVSASGFVPEVAREVTPGPPLTLRLTPAATISGVVYDSLDHPVAGAHVEAVATGGVAGQSVLGSPTAPPAAFVVAANSASLGTTSGPVPRVPVTPTLAPPPGSPPAAASSGQGALPWLASGGPSALTDAEGHFRIEGVPPGTTVLLATHPEHAPGVSATLRLRPGQSLAEQILVLPDGSLIVGRVVDSRGFPAAGVPILLRAEREPLPRMEMSGRDGRFEFAHVLGAASLTAAAPGLPEHRERVDAPPEGEIAVTLTLEDAFIELDGRTLDEAGFPVAGVQLQCSSLRYQAPSTQIAFSDGDGSFRFRGLPAPPWRVTASGAGRVSREIELDEVPPDGLDIRLAEAGEVRLSVHSDFDDSVVSSARVTLTHGDNRFPAQLGSTAGSYVMRDVPAGEFTVAIEADGFLPLERTGDLEPRPGSALGTDLGVLRLAPGANLEGDVVDAHGEPVAGASLALNDEVRPGVVSDAEGHFRLTGIAPDTYHVSATHPSYGQGEQAESVTLYASQTTPGVHIVLSGAAEESPEDQVAELRTGVAVTVETQSGHVRITAVLPGSLAAQAGLRVQDELVSVDGQPAQYSAQARSALRGPEGEDAVLSIRRGGRTRRVVVRRERYSLP